MGHKPRQATRADTLFNRDRNSSDLHVALAALEFSRGLKPISIYTNNG